MNRPVETTDPAVTDRQPVLVRPSRDGDVEAMLAIYRHHIRRGIEEGVDDSGTPEPEDLRDRRKNLRSHRLPHLVATCGGDVVAHEIARGVARRHCDVRQMLGLELPGLQRADAGVAEEAVHRGAEIA